jgi:N-acetylmuramoyl-L-alanine amidase
MSANELLKQLAQLYSQKNIQHPHLKEVSFAQWLLESGRATSALATEHNNFAGLKWRPEMEPFATRVKYTAHDGEDFYCKFATVESFINGYWAFINRSPYAGWEEHSSSGADYIRFIGPKYTPTAGYADKVLQLVPEAKTLLDSVAGSGPTNGGGSTTTTTPTPIPTTLPTLGTIVLDPGHGGTGPKLGGSSSNNATSASGVLEKQLTLEFCTILKDSLTQIAAEKNKQIKVVLTRTEDKNLSIRNRAAVAGEHKADLFICLHFNGMDDDTIRGVETYYKANGNMNLSADIDFANAVNKSLFDSLKSIDSKARNRGVKKDTESGPGGLGVLDDTNLGNPGRPKKCRACYVELEFISNPDVDRQLISGPNAMKNRKLVMGNLAKTLVNYLETH